MAEVSGIDPRRRASATTLAVIVGGGILIIGFWVAALTLIVAARSTAMDHARLEGRNLAAAFADKVTHTLDGVTAGVGGVAQRMRNESGPRDSSDWARKIPVLSFATVEGAIIGVSAIAAAITVPLAALIGVLIWEIRRRGANEAALNEERARLEVSNQQLQEAQETLRATMNHLNRVQRIAGIGSLSQDLATGHFEWSAELCSIFGLDKYTIEPTREYFLSLVHPDDRTKVADAARQSRLDGVRPPPLEYRIIRPDGAVRIVYRENDILVDPDGRPFRRILTYKDITDLKATEARLRQSMVNLDRAQRLSHTGSVSRNYDADQVEWSEETYRICGVDPSDFTPTFDNFLSLVTAEDRPKVLATEQEIARGRTPAPFEYRIRRADGDIRCIHCITEVIRDQDGVSIQKAATIQDVTELRAAEKHQKELEALLLHSQKLEAVGTLAGGIAHEINNALVPILALSRMILDGLPPTSDIREDIEVVVQAAQRTQGLVQGILAFSRKEEASKTEIDPVQLVNRTLSMLRASLPATLQIAEELAPVPPILADCDALQHVLVNLVTNAAHAIGNAIGTVTVAVEPARPEEIPGHHIGTEFIRVRIADTGCGMDPMTLSRIFEPFFTTKNVGEGTGLGLSVVHGIVTDHGGQIKVRSEPGKGTEFSIYLPSSLVSVPLAKAAA